MQLDTNKYMECVGIGKSYPMKMDANFSINTIISKNRFQDKGYNAINDVSFDLYEGDRLGIIGSNGAGKSTLMKIIAGVIKPTKGYIKMRGENTAILEPNNLLYKDLTGIENINIVGRLMGLTKKEISTYTNDIIEFSEIGSFVYQPVRSYSSGMMLRLTMAIYKYVQPDILLLDEILSVGDAKFRKKIFDTFKNEFSNIPVMIMVSHEISDIVKFCNKCIYLKDGEVVFMGETSKVYEKYSLEHYGKVVPKVYENTLEIKISNNVSILTKKYSEPIHFDFELNVKSEIDEFKLVFYLSNSKGPVLTDSLVFRDGRIEKLSKGKYSVSITIPPFFLNKGEYFTNCIIETKEVQLLADFKFPKLIIQPDIWEEDQPWNIAPVYPLRPKLDWKIDQLQ